MTRPFFWLLLLLTAAALCPPAGGQPPPREDWSLEHQEIANHEEAELVVRHGSVNNLGFGWPQGFDPFSGAATPVHVFPWPLNPKAAAGTDRIMVPSSYNGNPPNGQDGYTRTTRRPANNPQPIPITFTPPKSPIRAAILQVFVDDFQAPVWGSKFQVTMNGKRVAGMEDILNALEQSGPIGKLVTYQLPPEIVATLGTGKLTVLVDDPKTGAGDGYAFDFFRLLINPRASKYKGTVTGRVTDAKTGKPVAGATVSAGDVVKTKSAADGTYELRDVPAGYATVTSYAEAYNRKTVPVDLPFGQTRTVDLALKRTTVKTEIIDPLEELGGPDKKNAPKKKREPRPIELKSEVPPSPKAPAPKKAPESTAQSAAGGGEAVEGGKGFPWLIVLPSAGGGLLLVLALLLFRQRGV